MVSGKREVARAPFNSVVALAAAVSLAVGAFWWTITLRQERAPSVQLIDGSQKLNVAPDGRADQLRSLPAALQQAVADALRTGRLEISADVVALKRAIPAKSTLSAGQVPTLRALRPVGTAVPDGQPRFRWRPEAEATGYQVTVIAAANGATILSGDLFANATEWQPNEPLSAGESYRWEVQAFHGRELGARSPATSEGEARFRVLSPEQLAQWEELKRTAGSSHLALGVADARAGLLDEAAAEFYALAVQNPRSEIVRQLLEQLDANKR
ncbi:MAG: hypothetical protein ABR526_09470 [Chthoniobacterales bacterium]